MDKQSQLEPSSGPQGVFDGPRSQIMEGKNIWRFVFAAIAVLICSILHNRNVEKAKARAPYLGYRTSWEPTFLVRLRFIKGAWLIIMDGYNKYKDSTFWIRRNDRDILILLNKCVDELLAIPVEKLRGTEAQLENLRGLYYMDVAIRSTLHTRSLNQKMNPNLQAYVDVVRDELAYAMEVEIPKSEGWTEVPIEDLLLRIIARIGLPLCQNEEWLRTSRDLGVNVFTTVLILRELPPFLRPLHPIIVRCLPSWHRMQADFSIYKRLIAPVLEQHASKKTSGKNNDDGPASPLLNLDG